MEIIKLLITVACGYLLGSVSFSILISRTVLGEDVRKKGSGNAGATNMARVFGLAPGIITLFGDALKAFLAMLLGRFLLGDLGLAAGGLAVLIGHCFPVLHHFRGGKGVSVGAVIGLMVDWRVFVVIACAFFAGALLTKKVSVGSLCAAVSISIAALAFHVSTPKLVLCLCGMCLVVFQHRGNIQRLLAGTEPNFKPADKLPKRCKRRKDVEKDG